MIDVPNTNRFSANSALPIEVGQQFIEAEAPRRIWTVARLMTPPGGIPHAQLRLVNDPSTVKLLSVRVLLGKPWSRIEDQAVA